METGGAERLVVVEPLQDPVPREVPAESGEMVEVADEPERVPA